jgi:tyrosine-protein kinase
MLETGGSSVLTIGGLAGVMRRRGWIVVVATLLAGLAGNVAAARRASHYESSAVLLVGPINAGIDTLRASGPLAETYAELAKSRPLVTGTERATGAGGLAGKIRVRANQATRLLTIDVRDTDPARAARIANAHADTMLRLAARRASGSIPSGRLSVVDPAVPDRSSVGPSAPTITVLAALAGLAAALLLVVLADRSAATVADEGDLELLTGIPCLAAVGRGPLGRGRGIPVIERAPRSRAAEDYRLLAAKLEALGGRTIAVLSVDGGGGVVAANLAGALTARGARIALVDLDAAGPVVDGDPDGEDAPDGHVNGTGPATIDGDHAVSTRLALRRPESSDVERALRGGTQGARKLLRELLADADIVVLHPPGGAASLEGLTWARVAEATLIAVERERTPRRDIAAAVQSLRLVQARLAGAVLTPGSRWQ